MHPGLAGLQSERTQDWGKDSLSLGASMPKATPPWGEGLGSTGLRGPSPLAGGYIGDAVSGMG